MAAAKLCSISDCDKPHFGRGLCSMHLARLKRHGDPLGGTPQRSTCSIDGCGKRHYGHGYCSAHYQRWRTHGDPLAGGTPNGEPMRYCRETVLSHEGEDCLPWPYARDGAGYGLLNIDGMPHRIHRMVCEEINGPSPTPEHVAAHSCGKGHEGCCAPAHLSWKTQAENVADRLIHDTHNRGERHPDARITEAQARRIKAMKGTMTQPAIAKELGVTLSTVRNIHARRSWVWLDEEAA